MARYRHSRYSKLRRKLPVLILVLDQAHPERRVRNEALLPYRDPDGATIPPPSRPGQYRGVSQNVDIHQAGRTIMRCVIVTANVAGTWQLQSSV